MSQPQYTCPRCGAQITLGQKFCARCSLPLDAASLAAFRAQAPMRVVAGVPSVPPVRRGRRWLLLGGCGSLLVLLVMCAGLGVVLPRSPATPTPVLVTVISNLATETPTTVPPTTAPAATSMPPTTTPAATSVPPTAIPVPTDTIAALATDTVVPAPISTIMPPSPTTVAYASGGLGLTKGEWDRKHGDEEHVKAEWYYENRAYTLFFWADTQLGVTQDAIVEVVFRNWVKGQEKSAAAAQVEARQLAPTDAKLINRLEDQDTGEVTETYYSKSLSARYPTVAHFPPLEGPNPWQGEAPGTFTIQYLGNGLEIAAGSSSQATTPVSSPSVLSTRRPAATATRPVATTTPAPTTPPVGAYQASARVSVPAPPTNSAETVIGTLTRSGAPVAGATMHTVWQYKTVTSTCDGNTAASGTGSCTRKVSKRTAGFIVVIEVSFSVGGQVVATTQTSFAPPP